MIDISYAKAILNMLVGRSANGSSVTSYTEEMAFDEEGIPEYVTGQEMYKARDNDETLEQYRSWQTTINNSIYWKTEDYAPYEYTYGGNTTTYTGWKRVRKNVDVEGAGSYPQTRYLALFTTMPNADGSGFIEPYGTSENPTTYKRVNLNSGYFSKQLVMDEAKPNPTGGAITLNMVTIYYPEITGENWATTERPLVGFGIFKNQEPAAGEVPYLWGLLNNDKDVDAEVDHVPLFRAREFQLLIS